MTYQETKTTVIEKRDVFALSFALLIAYVASSTIYTLYFHPLSKFPGPFWARVSTIPCWWHTRKKKRHLWLLEPQEKYGTAVCYRPDSVCINTPTAFREIYGPRGNVKKAESYRVWHRTVDAQNTWSTTSVKLHARKRRVLNNAFSDAALRGAEPFLHSNTDRWLELLGQQKKSNQEWTSSVNMADQVTYLVFDILGDLCYGTCFDMKETENKLRGVIEMMNDYVSLLYPISWSPISPFWMWLKPRGLDRTMVFATPAKARAWDDFVSDCQTSRAKRQCDPKSKSSPELRKDIYHWLWDAKDPITGKGYSLAELNAECELLTIAGSDTTATVISALIFYLCRNPKVQYRLAKELSDTFSSYDDIKAGAKLQSCRYLTAVIQEGMRMAPPVAADLPREVLLGGTTIENQYIPQGMFIGSSSWGMHYNASHYPDPYKFLPERWIIGEAGATEESVATAESAFFAFSFGTRNCVGKNMAWLEMRLVLAKLLWKYEIQSDPNNRLGGGDSEGEWGRQHEEQYQTYDVFVADRKGPMVHLKERLHMSS